MRAAKTVDTSTSSIEELSDDSFISDLPKTPDVPTKRHSIVNTQEPKITKDAQKDYADNSIHRLHAKNANTIENPGTSNSRCIQNSRCIRAQKDESRTYNLDSQCSTNLAYNDDICHQNDNMIRTTHNSNNNDSFFTSSPNSNKRREYTQNLPNIEQGIRRNMNNKENGSVPLAHDMAGSDLEEIPEYTQNLPNIEQGIRKNRNNEENGSVPLAHDMAGSDLEEKSDKFQRFVRKLTNLEMKVSNLEMKINRIENHVKTNKAILQKRAISNVEEEEKEKIDIFLDLPLKDEANLQLMEIQLKNDSWYRNQMIKQLTRVTSEDMKKSCIRLMRAIVSNELAIKYSWFGAKKKQVFSILEICKVVMDVIRKLHPDVTDEQISTPIKIWLAHAKERLLRQCGNVQDQQ